MYRMCDNWTMIKKYTILTIFFLLVAGGSAFAQTDPGTRDTSVDKSMSNFILNDAVKMYPNPVQNVLNIQSQLPITGVEVYSLLGELVLQRPASYSRIYVGDLNPGIYMVKIRSNQYSVTKKLIKK